MIMTRKLFASITMLLLVCSVFAQDKEKKAGRPDLPGAFIIEFGLNRAMGSTPARFVQGVFGSRTLNLYYQYPIRLWKSKFSINPAIGFSLERYKLTNNYTLNRQIDADGSYSLVPANDLNMPNADKSMLIMNYLDFTPAEISFNTNPDNPSRSIHVSVGARVGILFDSHTKVNYSEGGESKMIKDKQPHGLNFFRYGISSKIGIGPFSFFGYYNLSPLFQENKGPDQTQMNTLTFGISLSGF